MKLRKTDVETFLNLTRNVTCCNNHNDLLHLGFPLKNSVSLESYI